MRLVLRLTGNLLIACSALGIVGLAASVLLPERSLNFGAFGRSEVGPPANALLDPRSGAQLAHRNSSGGLAGDSNAAAQSRSVTQAARPITRLEIAAIGLEADVVPAGLIPRDGGVTWDVPAFKVGHAETTAGAGQAGNAVLLGHVTSVHSGNVFADLERIRRGDSVRVFDQSTGFEYSVISSFRVDRSDSSVLERGDRPALSLITCTGFWLPTIWDYTERLVVRAELVSERSS